MEDPQDPKAPQQPKQELIDQPKETPEPVQASDLPGGEKKEDEKEVPENQFGEKLRPKKTKARFIRERERRHQIAAGYGDEESIYYQISNTSTFNGSVSGLINTGSGEINNYTHNYSTFSGSVSGQISTGGGAINNTTYNHHYHASQTASTEDSIAHNSINIDYVRRTRSVYITPSGYNRAEHILIEKRIVILHGSGAMGAHITATHLLQSVYNENILEVDPGTSIAKFNKSDFPEGRGYIINKARSEALMMLNRFELERLSNRLEAQKSHLVMTIDPDTTLNRHEMNDYIVQWIEVPNRTELLKNHLTWYMRDTEGNEASITDLCQHPEIQTMLVDLLPGKINNLANQLARVVRGEDQLDAVLSTFASDIPQEIKEWFTKHTSLEDCVRMLTLAVFNGAKWQNISKAADHLLERIRPKPRNSNQPPTPPLFDHPRGEWVNECRAVVFSTYEQIDFDAGISKSDDIDNDTAKPDDTGNNNSENIESTQYFAERIKFSNNKYQREILNYVWSEYAHFHTHILDWLKAMAQVPTSDVRDRAAAAVGQLCKYDFEYVYRNVLVSWASNPKEYTLAADALNTLALDQRYQWQIQALLANWSNQKQKSDRSRVAAATYGGYIGWMAPNQALRDLYTLIQKWEFDFFDDVRISLFELLHELLKVRAYEYVLWALEKWSSKEEKPIIVFTDLVVFLDIAQDSLARVNGDQWPTLLWMANANQEYYEKIVLLWSRALAMSHTRSFGLEVLHRWIQLADKHAYIYDEVHRLIHGLFEQGTRREKERLRFYLQRWTKQFRKKSTSASTILSTLA